MIWTPDAQHRSLGAEDIPPVTVYGTCDFTLPERVKAVQAALGVAASGSFDAATCAAWYDKYGHAPTVDELAAITLPGASCANGLVPACEEPGKKGMSQGTMIALGIGGGLLLAFGTLALQGRTRRRR